MGFVFCGMPSIGDRIKERRVALGLDWYDLARATGLRWQTFQQLEENPTRGSKHLVLIARALITTAEQLYDGRGPEPISPELAKLITAYHQASKTKRHAVMVLLEEEASEAPFGARTAAE